MPQLLDNLTYTWNNVGTTFTGIKYNVTDTASAAGSLLMDLQVGGNSQFSVRKDGRVVANNTLLVSSAVSDITGLYAGRLNISGNITGIGGVAGGRLGFWYNSTLVARVGENGFGVQGTSGIQFWTSGFAGTQEFQLLRDGAHTLAQYSGTNAQTFRVYNTFTDTLNYERGKIEWASNVLRIGTEKLGSGTARALEFQTDGTTRLTIGTTGTVTAAGDIGWPAGLLQGAGISIAASGNITIGTGGGARSSLLSSAAGNFTIKNAGSDDFGRLQFGGTTSSFPALKRDTTSLQARLADDSAFTNIQGKLTTETAYTAGAPTATGYLVLYDSNGTAYKVPAEAL
jgi:hypothetical protein